ncbi:ABC transporter ATP-binding protein [Thiohalomonas denitrificans]|nr:ATP-binding cassette domain-containing protein [Thiohalomonas denitrificans]
MVNEYVLEVRNLHTCFAGDCIHEDLNFEVRRGEIFAVVGGSGSGKTVLLREALLLQEPTAGTIRIFGEASRRAEKEGLRQRTGVLFQHGALFSSLTVQQNVEAPLLEHTTLSPRLRHELGCLKLALVGLASESGRKLPSQLSGGMLKRAALARALALDPELLFLDEPTAGLDPASADALDELILQLRDSLGLTVVMITHDLDTLWRAADRAIFLGEGRILAGGTMEEISGSGHPLVQAYFQGNRGRGAREAAWNPG